MSDTKHHGILDSIKSLAFDEVPDQTSPASTPAPRPTPPRPFAFNFGGGPSPTTPVTFVPPATSAPSLSSFVTASTPTGPEAEEFYQKLLTKTNFDTSGIAGAIQKFIVPLQSLITDRQMLFKAAVATAKSQAGVTEKAILNTFDTLKAVLLQAEESFAAVVAAFEATAITARISWPSWLR